MWRGMEKERRRKLNPIPVNTYTRLNTDQLLTLVQVEEFGWHMSFVRQPSSLKPIYVVYNDFIDHYAVLNEDGSLSIKSDIAIRGKSETEQSLS